MADEDDDRGTVGPEELFAPTGPRRSNFTPPTNDAETLEAAASVFNDDAIAAALAAELAKVASGPIPIIRPTPTVEPEPEPEQAQEPEPDPEQAQEHETPTSAPEAWGSTSANFDSPIAPVQPAPEYVAPVEPAAVYAPPAEADSQIAEPEAGGPEFAIPEAPAARVSSVPEPSTVWSLDSESPSPAAEAQPTSEPWADAPPPVSPPAPAYSWTPASEFVPTSAPSVPAYAAESAPDEQPEPEPWPPAPEASVISVDVPPPYLGAPAPTVPPADAPPPPGYDAPAPSHESQTAVPPQEYQAPAPAQDYQAPVQPQDYEQPQPAAQPYGSAELAEPVQPVAFPAQERPEPQSPQFRPHRRSLADDELLRSLRDDDGGSDGTLSAIEQLQEQLELRAREAREYSVWEQSMVSLGTPDALAAVEEARAEFAGVVAPELAPPSPEPQATPEPPVDIVVPSPDVPFVSVEPDAPDPSQSPAWGHEPSLEGTAFADLFSPSPVEQPAPVAQPAPVEQPASGEWSAPAEQATIEPEVQPADSAPVEPPAPDGPLFTGFAPPADSAQPFQWSTPPEEEPPLAPAFDLPDSPVFLEPPALIEPPASPTTPSGDFESLLEVNKQEDKPDGQPSTWLAPAPNASVDPPIEAESGDRRPFGEGVERDKAVDPSDSIFGSTLGAYGPVSVNTAGVAVVGESILLDSRPILIQRAEPLPPEPEPIAAPGRLRVFSPELAGEEPTPLEYRVGRAARLFWLWFASNSSVVAVVFGGMIFALGMSLRQAVVATLAGIAVSFLPLGLGTLAGKRSGQPTMVVSRATFGVAGNIVPAAIALLSRLFWAAALLWLFGAGLASILVQAKLTDGFTEQQLTMILMVLAFAVAIVIAYFGYALIAGVQLVISIVSGILVVGFIALTLPHVNVQTALTIGDGNWALVITGAVLVFSFVGLVWANSSSDLARYQRVGSSGASSMLWATFGTALPTFVLIAYGALLASSDPQIARGLASNPLPTLGRLLPTWYPVPLLLAAGLSLLSGTVIAMYSGGFALQAIGLRLRRSGATIIVGVLVLLVAILLTVSITNFTELFRDFATTVAVPVAAWAGMFAAEIMIRNRRFDSVSLLRRGGVYATVRWSNLIALVVIAGVGLGLTSATIPWLSWEGFLFPPLGISLGSQLAATDLGVFVALLLGVIYPIVAGVPAIRRQESAERPAE